jgi:hypothetical protein
MVNSNLVACLQTPTFDPTWQPYPQSWGYNSGKEITLLIKCMNKSGVKTAEYG